MRKTIELTGKVSLDNNGHPISDNVKEDVEWVKNQARPFLRQGWFIVEDLTVTVETDGNYRVHILLDDTSGMKPILWEETKR